MSRSLLKGRKGISLHFQVLPFPLQYVTTLVDAGLGRNPLVIFLKGGMGQ